MLAGFGHSTHLLMELGFLGGVNCVFFFILDNRRRMRWCTERVSENKSNTGPLEPGFLATLGQVLSYVPFRSQ